MGPTHDGGYWTLAAGACRPALLHQIDWGTAVVYDQTVQRAGAAGLSVCSLPAWYDVDALDDVAALRVDRCCHYGRAGHERLADLLEPRLRAWAEGR